MQQLKKPIKQELRFIFEGKNYNWTVTTDIPKHEIRYILFQYINSAKDRTSLGVMFFHDFIVNLGYRVVNSRGKMKVKDEN